MEKLLPARFWTNRMVTEEGVSMTVSDYRKWLSEQQKKSDSDALEHGDYKRNIGRRDAFREALKKLPDSFDPEKEPEKEGFDWTKVTMNTIVKHKKYGYGIVEFVNVVDVGIAGEYHFLEMKNNDITRYKPALIWRTEAGERKGVLLTADTLKDFEKIGKWGPDDFPKDAERSFWRREI